uniref:Serine/threonine-protein phosphatase CPPED1-like n=1 Tax=Dermatophagoides pteronyssinus TaxID=6956 RepID=A0A6P6YI74_DERPT|nr:serine/threonine-protein phosphatase CPPED1-like [Dermatophagoides pteronyssinus]
MQKSIKIFITIIIIGISITIIGLLLYFNPDWPDNNDNDDRMFKRAHHRTYEGFEKDYNLEWKKDFFFIQAADPQYGLMEKLENPNLIVSKNWTNERELLTKAIKQWNEMNPKPRFVVICGDLVNDPPFQNQTKRREQLNDLKKDLHQLDQSIPLILLPGNHDLMDKPTLESLKQYTDEFGDDYYSFWIDSIMFIVLNTQYYKNHDQMINEFNEQNKWIDEQLMDAKSNNYTHVIIFQHIPWFLKKIDEPDMDYNTIASKIRQPLMEKFIDANIHYIFAGHMHQNFEGEFFINDNRWLKMITTSAIGAQYHAIDTEPPSKSGYRIVNVTRTNIQQKYVQIEKE